VLKIRKYHKDFLGVDLSDDEHARWVQRYGDIVEDQVVAAPAVAGALEFLDSHTGRMGLYVVSGTPEDELKRIVAAKGWEGYFDGVFGSPRLKPAIIDAILAEAGLERGRTLFVGDAMTDYNAARETGLRFLGRVPQGGENLFPPGTEIVPDLTGLGTYVLGKT
ncbi:MAG: HAD family hydrolase, partial [Alphaproteobacteria bacterium]|nr:HAD family hydrolase [Alphaproteobacteria bacterium]